MLASRFVGFQSGNMPKSGQLFRVAVLAVCLVLGGAPGCGLRQSPEDQLNAAKDAHRKGDRSSAVIQLKSALQQKPEFAPRRKPIILR